MGPTRTRPDELANLRDVGGLPTDDGRTTRAGVLWRADAPLDGDVTAGPGGLPWPPAAVVDLREPGELPGPHPLPAHGSVLTSMPLIAALAPGHRDRGRAYGIPLDELYLLVLDTAATWLPDLFALAARGPAPVLVHCAAGKDRTGLAVAVLLRAAGVTRAAVAADFAETNHRSAALHARLVAQGMMPADEDVARASVEPAHLEAVLDRLEPDPRALPREAGVPEPDLAAWRDRLLGAA